MMSIIFQYYNLVRLNSSGKILTTEISQAKQFLQQHFSDLITDENISHPRIQNDLVAVRDRKNELQEFWAQRCLRCFISHQIKQICIQLETQFGREHNFTRSDLFIYTLNDTLDNFSDRAIAKPSQSTYKPLAVEILSSFDPKKATLSTWTSRLVRQNKELQRFLLEQGVYLISNWAILNDTNLKQLRPILGEFHSLTDGEIREAEALLDAYHSIYRSDRLKNRQGKGGKCQTPSVEQLERIAILLKQKHDLVFSAEQTLFILEQLSSQLREYRIYVRGGKRKQEQSFDNAEQNTEGLQASVVASVETIEEDRNTFLQTYQQQFLTSLVRSIAEVIQLKVSKFKGKKAAKASQYLQALELFHCQGKAMGEIATIIGLQAQFQVTRLLKLKELRADIRQTMLRIMGDWTIEQSAKFSDPEVLKARESAIAEALAEQVDALLGEAEKEVSVAGSNRSILARKICDYLDSEDR